MATERGRLPGRAAAWLAAALAASGPAAAADPTGDPMSAIDWLSRSLAMPVAPLAAPDPAAAPAAEPLPAAPLLPGEIGVSAIDGPTPDALGLTPAARAGLPRGLWGASAAETLAEGLRALGPDTLPALQALAKALLVAELDPPAYAERRGTLFLARIDTLIAFGALDAAQALVEAADPSRDPETFARWLDLALLAGEAEAPCAALRAAPDLAADPAALIYCLARGGEWEAAEERLTDADLALDPAKAQALAVFLDPDDAQVEMLAAPQEVTPLLWQLRDAIGEPLGSPRLPLAYAHADLRNDAGWRAQIEAAERLARAGVLTPNRLLGLYTERAPAASGGVWERVAAVQALEAALLAADAAAAATAFTNAWAQMRAAELEVPFATLYAERMERLAMPEPAAGLVFRAGLLTDRAEDAARAREPADAAEAFLAAIATGTLDADTPLPPGPMAAALRDGLLGEPAPLAAELLAEGRSGEVVLAALARLQDGGWSDPAAVAEALASLRAAGLGAQARQAALQILLLERRG